MKTAKLGALFLISIMALAGVGAGYAAWTDTITISGTVNTGTVDLVIDDLSGTWVYKIPEHGFEMHHDWGTTITGDPYPPANGELIASATAEYDSNDPTGDTIIVTTSNLFPSVCFMVDFLIHYEGSIPARIFDADIDSEYWWLEDLWDLGYIGICAFWSDEFGNIYDPVDPCDLQLHYCDWVIVGIYMHIPQYWPDGTSTDNLMGLSGSFTAHVTVGQWNEAP